MKKDSEHSGEPVWVALIGLGGHGRTIQDAVEEAGTLAVRAVYDPVDGEAERAAARFGCARSPSYEDVLSRHDLDAVVLVTPNHLHRAQAEAAFAAGLHVFVEKPIANTLADAQAMIAAARAADRTLMVGHNMRRCRPARLARRLLKEGRLGEVVSIEIHFSMDTIRRLPPDSWRLRKAPLLPVMQLGIHAVDLVHYWLGPIREVYGRGRSVTTASGVMDSVTAIFATETGVLGTLVSNYCTQVAFEYRLAGTGGSLHGTPHRLWFRRTADTDAKGRGPAEIHEFIQYDGESYVLQMRAFAEAVHTGWIPETDGWVGLKALAVVEALHHAIQTGTPQKVTPFENRQLA